MDRLSYEKVSKVTLEKLEKDGFCVWTCEKLGNEKITIVRDRSVFDTQMRFSDPRREAADYPRYTVQELRTIREDSDLMISRVNLYKKLYPDLEVVTE